MHTSHCNSTYIRRIVERGDKHLRIAFKLLGSRNVFNDCIKHGIDVVGGLAPVEAHPVLLCRAIYCGEIKLLLGGIEVEHQVEHHLLHLIGTTVGLIHLIYHHNGFQSHLNGFLKHKSRLWHRTLKGVNEQQAAICHIEHSLHLASKVGVSRGVYNIDFISVVVYRNILREDCDSTLSFQIIVVEH